MQDRPETNRFAAIGTALRARLAAMPPPVTDGPRDCQIDLLARVFADRRARCDADSRSK